MTDRTWEKPEEQALTAPGDAPRPGDAPVSASASHHDIAPAPTLGDAEKLDAALAQAPADAASARGSSIAPSLAEQVALVPTDPGCYLWKDAKGNVLYVGKAKNLRARMRQYVQLTDERPMVPRLMAATASFDYVVVGSEHEALVLEINLIH